MASLSLPHIDSNDFDEIIYDNAEPSLIIFSRENCNICKGMVLVLEELQEKYNGIYNFYYVDVEKQMNLFQRFSLQGVPQILFFKDGAYQGKLAGHVIDEKVEEKIAEVVKA